MEFIKGAVHVEFSCPAQFPQDENTKLIQAKDYSGSGIKHTEDFSVKTGLQTFVFVDFPGEDYLKLLEFFINEANGMMEEFTLIDDLGVSRVGTFTEPEIKFRNTSYDMWSGSFSFEQSEAA